MWLGSGPKRHLTRTCHISIVFADLLSDTGLEIQHASFDCLEMRNQRAGKPATHSDYNGMHVDYIASPDTVQTSSAGP